MLLNLTPQLAATICAQLLFTRNHRHNAFQLFNSLRYVPTGVTERVNNYLHKLGMTSSRQTAIEVLKTLMVMKTEKHKVKLEREKIATGTCNSIILACHERFCSPRSHHEAAKDSCPKLHNLL
ncbi:hypothetical protein MJO28_016639, partial [Puccinia striiformis f. sp. tritici]